MLTYKSIIIDTMKRESLKKIPEFNKVQKFGLQTLPGRREELTNRSVELLERIQIKFGQILFRTLSGVVQIVHFLLQQLLQRLELIGEQTLDRRRLRVGEPTGKYCGGSLSLQ